MGNLDVAFNDVHVLDRLSEIDSPIRCLDPRAKVIVTMAFLLTVVSFPNREVAELMPLCLYPAVVLAVGRVPASVLGRYLLLASPVAILVGAFNPVFDRHIVFRVGSVAISGGWLSFFSILVRFVLTVSAALLLLACTGYVGVCSALGRLGAPRLLVTQFVLLYRFIFVLSEEGSRMVRAHRLRAPDSRWPAIRVWTSLAGHLLLRAFDRGARLHAAMLSRGFDGFLRTGRSIRWRWTDTLFVSCWCGFFALVRFGHLAERLGRWTLEALS